MQAQIEPGASAVDSVNQNYYSQFPYPWPPMTFPRLEDARFETVMLNQSVGDFSHRTIPPDANIWVSGCGTNQAVYTALRFPEARIIASDLSPTSLDIARRNANTLGVRNLTFCQESVNDARYAAQFDYVICTGVIDHNAEPASTLARVAATLRPNGVLELMVYNRFHRTFHDALQKALRLIKVHIGGEQSYARDLELARELVRSGPLASSAHAETLLTDNDAFLADALIQPVEHTFTVESLAQMAGKCGLELTLPCSNQFDSIDGRTWNLQIASRPLQDALEAMPDVERWQMVNLILFDKSPMLWFFLRPRGEQTQIRHEAKANAAFLERRFVCTTTGLSNYVRGASDLHYKRAPNPVPYPSPPKNLLIRQIVARADGEMTMREILEALRVDIASRRTVSDIRTGTTTSRYPYLRSL
jgi:SAM-dependent methyltransferase